MRRLLSRLVLSLGFGLLFGFLISSAAQASLSCEDVFAKNTFTNSPTEPSIALDSSPISVESRWADLKASLTDGHRLTFSEVQQLVFFHLDEESKKEIEALLELATIVNRDRHLHYISARYRFLPLPWHQQRIRINWVKSSAKSEQDLLNLATEWIAVVFRIRFETIRGGKVWHKLSRNPLAVREFEEFLVTYQEMQLQHLRQFRSLMNDPSLMPSPRRAPLTTRLWRVVTTEFLRYDLALFRSIARAPDVAIDLNFGQEFYLRIVGLTTYAKRGFYALSRVLLVVASFYVAYDGTQGWNYFHQLIDDGFGRDLTLSQTPKELRKALNREIDSLQKQSGLESFEKSYLEEMRILLNEAPVPNSDVQDTQ